MKFQINLDYETRRAILGGFIAMAITLVGAYLLGHLSGYEAKMLIEASIPSFNMLCNTVILASATILALLLTALGLSARSNQKLKRAFYQRIRRIAQFDTMLFVMSMLIFLILNIPIVESEEIPTQWFYRLYLISLGAASLIGGFLITVVLMLYNTVLDMIVIFGIRPEEHPLIELEQEDAEEIKE